jgi:hypothetical protein
MSVTGWRSGARLVLWLLVLLIGLGPSPAATAGPEKRVRSIDTPVELSVSASGSERPAGVGCSRLNPDETTGAPCVAVLTVPSTDAASISASSHESTCYVYDAPVVVRVGGADNDSPAGPVVHVGVGSEWSVAPRSAAAGTRTTRFATFIATNTGGYDLYHGTDADSAQDIVENGLSSEAAGNLGGGDVFWVTTSLSDARFFSQANPADGPPAVVGIDLPAGVAAAIRSGLLEPVAGLPGACTVKDWSKFNRSANLGIVC